jgi:hypothetical protein
MHLATSIVLLLAASSAHAHDLFDVDAYAEPHGPFLDAAALLPGEDAFRQLDELWPTPNDRRTATGAPGPAYWQNEADHDIAVTLDPETHVLTGSERITYTNNSPHTLPYLWVQLDQNRFREDSIGNLAATGPSLDSGEVGIRWLRQAHRRQRFEGGTTVDLVVDARGAPLDHTVTDTMMRIDLPRPLRPGQRTVFRIDWHHQVVPEQMWARSKVEILDDGVPLYEIAQWFPRMAPYTDTDGWQNKAFTGRGEFALEFGDYDLDITVPDTYVVTATGELTNAGAVLTPTEQRRLASARGADAPVLVVTTEEAAARRATTPTGTKTWRFRARDVRDVAWAASPAFLWDAWQVDVPRSDRTTMAMSLWPSEGDPLWERYSTQAVAHTIDVYSEHVLPYPYPVAISVNGPVGGMEYPMICFNGPRPEEDGTYTERTKYGLISVIIHEVGHNWFPMILNSDERQWTWMDEGLNTYVQFLAEQIWEDEYPSRRGEADAITGYMADAYSVPIMTSSESLLQFGNNGYAKPATAMNVLRELVLGREEMDHAMRTYGERWAFKRPDPTDLFRTLEDVSGVDLDWFYRGWFYSTDHVDVAVERVKRFELVHDAERAKAFARAERDARAPSRTEQRNAGVPLRIDRFPELLDFYSAYDELDAVPADTRAWRDFLDSLEDDERAAVEADWVWYGVRLRNVGGLVMPVPLRLVFEDGSEESVVLPAELWKKNAVVVEKLFLVDKAVAYVEVDTHYEIADTDRANNRFPQRIETALVRVTKDRKTPNPMQIAKQEENRTAGREAIAAFAPRLVAELEAMGGWDGNTAAVLSERLLALPEVLDARDPWDRPFVVELADDPEAREELAAGRTRADQTTLAVVRSAGEDGKPESADDLVWRILMDGSIRP